MYVGRGVCQGGYVRYARHSRRRSSALGMQVTYGLIDVLVCPRHVLVVCTCAPDGLWYYWGISSYYHDYLAISLLSAERIHQTYRGKRVALVEARQRRWMCKTGVSGASTAQQQTYLSLSG